MNVIKKGGAMPSILKSIKMGMSLLLVLALADKPGLSDDTCMFQVSAEEVPPNIVFLLDNGPEMEQIIWHSDYDNRMDYSPDVHTDGQDNDGDGMIDEFQCDPSDRSEEIQWEDGSSSNGFTNEKGYAIEFQGGSYFLVKVLDDLEPDSHRNGIEISSESRFRLNQRALVLPLAPSSGVDANGIKDNADRFRYAANYLNWLFYGSYSGDGSDLPDQSRLYFAKKAIFTVAESFKRQAYVGVYAFEDANCGAGRIHPLDFVYDRSGRINSNFIDHVNTLGTSDCSPLAHGLAAIGGYYGSPAFKVVSEYCTKNFAIVISSGLSSGFSSNDQVLAVGAIPGALDDYDNDDAGIPEGRIELDTGRVTIPTNMNGSTFLDDVAHYLYAHDIVDYQDGFQNIMTYTIGFMGNYQSSAYLINASNNGNGNLNLYDTTRREYGKYHYEAGDPSQLSASVFNAVTAILSKTSSFGSPVVPANRTTSGDHIYLTFFKPGEHNFWEGNVTKFGFSDKGDILASDGTQATWPNGAIKENAIPYWQTIDWADTTTSNGLHNSTRKIYTYLGMTPDLTDNSNSFSTSNITPELLETYNDAFGPLALENMIGTFRKGDVLTGLKSGATATVSSITGNAVYFTGLKGIFRSGEGVTNGSGGSGSIANTGTVELIQYIRGADVHDENDDHNIIENRKFISGDPLHSDPVVFHYGKIDTDADGTAEDKTMVFFGANDGMLHAVNDEDGTEAWAFIPPDLLPKLKNILQASQHPYYVDGSPAVLKKDYNGNGIIEPSATVTDGVNYPPDKVILVCGERKGGTSYFALDITNPFTPQFLWRIAQNDGRPCATTTIPELGESWSTPTFGVVKTSNKPSDPGTDVVFIGGGYNTTGSKGRSIYAIHAETGALVKAFTSADHAAMTHSIPSKIYALDRDYNGFVDKLYVGDMGGRIWRIGKFDQDPSQIPQPFPYADENIHNWELHQLFTARCGEADCEDRTDNNSNALVDTDDTAPFFYPPSVTLEQGFDLVFIGTGDRNNACSTIPYNTLYAIKDSHDASAIPLDIHDLINADIHSLGYTEPVLNSGDNGWYLVMDQGEKALAQPLVFNKTFYATTFLPNNHPCVPGGYARLYSLNYVTGSPAHDMDKNGRVEMDNGRISIGGGIPSRPVVIITEKNVAKLMISTGATHADTVSDTMGAGIPTVPLQFPNINFFLRWWNNLVD